MSRVHTDKRKVMGSNPTLVTTVTHEPDPDPEPPEPGSQHPSASAMTSHTPLAATRFGDPQLVDAHDRIRDAERRVTEIDDELAALDGNLLDERDVAATLADFDAVWECLAPCEQSRIVDLLVESVSYDGEGGNVAITFRPTGIKALAGELAKRKEEAA